MISGVNTQSLSMMQTSGAQTAQPPAGVNESDESTASVAGSKGPEGRPPPPPPPPPAEGSGGGEQIGGADTAALIESLFEAIDTTEDETDETSLLETLTLTAAEGYGTTQSLFTS